MSLTIAVLASGGDAPGMNAAAYGACRQVEVLGGKTVGVIGGFAGLAHGRIEPISTDKALVEYRKPGTWLGSSRWPRMETAQGVTECVNQLQQAAIDGIVVLGGNGSLLAATRLAERGIQTALVPCTIDNDVSGTITTIGIDSAVRYAANVIDRIRVTSHAVPGRVFVVETLGGPTGYLAEAVAKAANLDVLLVPERQVDLDAISERLRALAPTGEAIAVMSEGVGDAVRISEAIAKRCGLRVHPTILGHAQRAADPTRRDRSLAIRGGKRAVRELAGGRDSAFITFSPRSSRGSAYRLRTRPLIPTSLKAPAERESA